MMADSASGWRAPHKPYRSTRNVFRSILLTSMDAILIVDRDGLIRYANPAAETLFERPAQDLVGQEFGLPLTPCETSETGEIVIVATQGDRPVAEMRILDVDWENAPATMVWLRDTTHHKRQESALSARSSRSRTSAMPSTNQPLWPPPTCRALSST